MLLPLWSPLTKFCHCTIRQLDVRLIKKGDLWVGFTILNYISSHLRLKSSLGFDDAICNQVKQSDLNTGRYDGMSEIRDLHQSQLCFSLPPAILNHSYSSTHIDQVSAECCEMEWCGASYVMLRHLRRRSGLLTSPIPYVTLCHVAHHILDISQ